jgi:hypothetical protein
MNRFDNIATADLAAREQEARRELAEFQAAVRERLIAEAGIREGRIYRVTAGRFAGRRFKAMGSYAGIPDARGHEPFYVWAWGWVDAPGGGWGIRYRNIRVEWLEPEELP